MVSAAEQLAANLNFSALGKAEELKKRIWFTLGALLVYRLGTYIPLPGIDPNIWSQVFKSQAGGILGMFVGATFLALGYQIFMAWVHTNPASPATVGREPVVGD